MSNRFDAIGLFWQDFAREKKRRGSEGSSGVRPLAPIPEVRWTPPTEFPRLAAADKLIIDVETYDPNLNRSGPGDVRGDGELVGLAVGTTDGHRWYFPMRHRVQRELNMDPDAVLAWARDELSRPGQTKIGANLLYDLFWLQAEGVHVAGPYIDVQWIEAIINETAPSLALEALGQRYLGEGKDTNDLYEWCELSYGGGADQRRNIYRAPPSLVGPYAESDVDVPWRVYQKQLPIIEQWGVQDLVAMEHGLVPMLLRMRRRGIPVDVEGAKRLDDVLAEKQRVAQRELDEAVGPGKKVNVNAAQDLAVLFDREGVEYPRTRNGRPSFTKEWLEASDSPAAEAILRVRRYEKARGTFVRGYVIDSAINGRVYPLLHPLRTDENGAISGRFASSNPNGQNIPARDPELKPLIRGLFLPEPGCRWRSDDYSQIEYRMLAHVARGPRAEELRRQYREDPNTDFHVFAQELIRRVTDIELGRKPTKNINFGLCFGMGKGKLVRSLGVSAERGEVLFQAYHDGQPYVKATFDLAAQYAARRGYVRTIGGRIARFDRWEPRDWDLRQVVKASRSREKVARMVQEYIAAARREGERCPRPGVSRAFTHKALNRVLQGSAADVIKRAMVDIYEAGLCDVVDVPFIQVHDELNWNDPCTPGAREAFAEIERIMVECWPSLKVPLAIESATGANWGAV